MAVALFTLRLVHTLIVVVCIAMLVPLAHYALTGNGGRWAVLALLPPDAFPGGGRINLTMRRVTIPA